MVRKFDFLVIGGGVAGMSYALKVANSGKGKVAIVCKTTLDEANTAKAQGGIASVTNLKIDNFEKHIEDTMIAGDFISDPQAVNHVVRNAPAAIDDLVNWGVNFDKNADGEFDLHREGGHSEFRILHHADDTGFEIQRGLMAAVRQNKNITVLENHYAVEIITQHHLGREVNRHMNDIECYGAYVLNPETEKVETFLSRITLMATGGTGAVYSTTSNPNIATGDGIAMVYRAKGIVQDMEFVQFHPTVLYNPKETHPAFLITEAMRGYGGILRLPNGEEFMQKYDKRLSLAPRDIVARAIDREMKIHGLTHVCLDVTHKDPEETKHHFPNIYAKCLSIGIDITKQYIPVCPSAHYMCGGIKVDLHAESTIHRLYAVGECSCTGLHGGNRLASNSLIEAVVYAKSAAEHSLSVIDNYSFHEEVPEWNDEGTMTNEEKVLVVQDMMEVGQIMSNYVGIVRSDLRLRRAWTRLDIIYEETEELFKRVKPTRDICELRNMVNVGYLITRQAMERKESRGLHYTIDYPKATPAQLDAVPQAEDKKGAFIDKPIPDGIDLKTEIRRLCQEKNAMIMAHYYTDGAIQDVADFIGDSLALAQKAATTDADIIVMCGVHFMGETNKILCPDKKILVPDLNASCSLAESCPADDFAKFVSEHPDHTVISYVNTTAATKAVTDVVVTSSNARQIVESFPEDTKIIFGPDRNLGAYINNITGRNMLLWNGACTVHERFSVEKIVQLKAEHPHAKVLAHPECKSPVLQLADKVGSTAALLKFSISDDCNEFIVATESGILHEMQKAAPHKTFIPVPPADSTCACNECSFMRLVTLEKLYNTLRYEWPEITVAPDIIEKAVKPINRMLEISEKLGL